MSCEHEFITLRSKEFFFTGAIKRQLCVYCKKTPMELRLEAELAAANQQLHNSIGVITPSPEGGYCGYIPEVKGCITQGETIAETRDNLRDALKCWAEAAMESPWVSVQDELPETCCSCFIWHISKEFGPSCIAAHYNSTKKTFGHEELFGGKTTHWMPLPEPPKEPTP